MTALFGSVDRYVIERVARRRGAFGLDDRRRPQPERIEAELRAFLAGRLPEVWPLPSAQEPDDAGRTLALLLPQGHVAVLRIEAKPEDPGPAGHALAARCAAMRIPHATVSSLVQGRAALRRFGVEPRPVPAGPATRAIFRRS
jgi:hypothetical protein